MLLVTSIIIIIIYVVCVCEYNDEYDSIDDGKYIENYDGRISNITLTECGTECTNGYDCTGFAYKPINNICYLSKTSILGKPEDTKPYHDEYTKLDTRCNKINKMKDSDFINELTLSRNSVYMCSDGENNINNKMQYANLGASALTIPAHDGGSLSRDGIVNPRGYEDIAPTNVKYDMHDIKWTDGKKELVSTVLDKNIIKNITPKSEHGFVEDDREYLGQYMLSHQCVRDVPLYDCIKYCEDNSKCAGVEWNKSLGNKQNICCPKRIIKRIIPRRQQYSNGKFYIKKSIHDIINNDRIIITRVNDKSKIDISDNRYNKINVYSNVNDPRQQYNVFVAPNDDRNV